jgi:hypothetical protein
LLLRRTPGVHPEGEDGVHSIGLRFERVGVERRRVIKNVEIMQPLEVMQHERGAESGCIPFVDVAVNPARAFGEMFSRTIEFGIVVQILDADFKSAFRQPCAEIGRNDVPAFWNEIERRAKAVFHFELGELFHPIHTRCAFDIVRQDQAELFIFRPAGPVARFSRRARFNRPDVARALQNATRMKSPKGDLDAARKERLYPVIESAGEHVRRKAEKLKC